MNTENNKIIAEFMGAKETKDTKIMYPIYDGDSSYIKNLEYHKNWNWLMEVVEKIESLGYWTELLGGVHQVFRIGILDSTTEYISIDSKNKIEVVYNGCVTFIKWDNENK